MPGSAILGYRLLASNGPWTDAAVIGAVISTAGIIVAAFINNASANRRQRRELRAHGRQSNVNGLLILAAIVSVTVGIYFVKRPTEVRSESEPPVPPTTLQSVALPTALPTTLPTVSPTVAPSAAPTAAPAAPPVAAPITLEEASVFVASYLATANTEGSEEQAWAMLTEGDQQSFSGGFEQFKRFWQKRVDTVESAGDAHLLEGSTESRALVGETLTYRVFADGNADGIPDCTVETVIFAVVRINGSLQIDDYDWDVEDC